MKSNRIWNLLGIIVLLFVIFWAFSLCQQRMENSEIMWQKRKIAEQRKAASVTLNEDPFTLQCSTESEDSYVEFDITVEPRLGRSYVWDIRGQSKDEDAEMYTTSGIFLGMEREIYPVGEISSDTIVTGSLRFDRKNGNVVIDSVFGEGPCTRSKFRPIDSVKF